MYYGIVPVENAALFLSDAPCIRRLSPQYERQSKIRCPNETMRREMRNDATPFFSQLTKIKTMRKLLWPLLVVNLNITGLIWRGAAYFVQNNTTILLPCDTRRTTSDPFFGAKIEA